MNVNAEESVPVFRTIVQMVLSYVIALSFMMLVQYIT